MDAITESLLENSKSAVVGCVEIHNKPIFAYRYEVCVILAINAWELLLKAYISENSSEIKLIRKDGTSKPFDECISHVSSKIGKEFRAVEENLKKLYDFRCHIIHFYKNKMDVIVYSLLHKSIMFYHEFSKKYFNIDLTEETNIVLLPIGFKPFVSPIDFLSNKSEIDKSSVFVKDFVENIITSTQVLHDEGIEDSIFTTYKMEVINEKRTTNADIIAGITKNSTESNLSVTTVISNSTVTNDASAKKVFIEEESLFKTKYTLTYTQIADTARSIYSDFKQNAKFNRIMNSIKDDPNLHKKRFLDINNQSGAGRNFYSPGVFIELDKHYAKNRNTIDGGGRG